MSVADCLNCPKGFVNDCRLTRVIVHPDTRVWVKYHAKFGFMILPSITMEVAFQLYSIIDNQRNGLEMQAKALIASVIRPDTL